MDRPAAKTLVLPFERQNLPFPNENNKWLFLNAHPLENAALWRDGLVCEQGFRPLMRSLQTTGFDVTHTVGPGSEFAGSLVLTNRSKKLNEIMISRAVTSVALGGTILVAGEKTSGIAPLKKWVSKRVQVVDSFSKFHAQAFQFSVDETTKSDLQIDDHDPSAGVFGAGKIDRGSALLASTFTENMNGNIADFCAGTGYLTEQLLQRSSPESVDLYEAEYRSLELARKSLSSSSNTPMEFHWLDLGREPVEARYDWIVMNPPFHSGRAAEPSIGQGMIRAARKALRPGGRLRLVANRQLPYENTLKETFGSFREIVAENGFKVLQA